LLSTKEPFTHNSEGTKNWIICLKRLNFSDIFCLVFEAGKGFTNQESNSFSLIGWIPTGKTLNGYPGSSSNCSF
jgi:hypothetical protein